MRKLLFLSIFLILTGLTRYDKSSEIINAGDVSKEEDQIILSENLAGNYYESTSDSKWGSENDINQISVTWDNDFLYIEATVTIKEDSGNNAIIYIDLKEGGITTADNLSLFPRKITFINFNPDIFLIFGKTWGGVYSVNENGEVQSLSSYIFKSNKLSEGKWVILYKIPWTSLYTVQQGRVKEGTLLKLIGIITGGDNSSTPDTAPNQTEELPAQWDQPVTIENFIIIPVDQNNDESPDLDISVKDRATTAIDVFSEKKYPFEIQQLTIHNSTFTPDNDGVNDTFYCKFYLTRRAKLTAKVYNLNGDIIRTLKENFNVTQGWQKIEWDGYKDNGKKPEPGLYIIYILIDSYGSKLSKKIPVYKIK